MMSQGVPYPEAPDVELSIELFHRRLCEALNLADELTLPPEIGARLQEVIDLTEGCLGSKSEPD